MAKKITNLLNVVMGAYHGAEVCEILVLFLLNNSTNKFGKYNFGSYRDRRGAWLKYNLNTGTYKHIANLMMKYFIPTQNLITLKTPSNS